MGKLLFITTRPINPINSGTKVVLYNYCKYLNEQLNYEVYLYSFFNDIEETFITQPRFIKEQYYLEQPKFFEKLWNLFRYTFIKQIPIQCSMYYKKKNLKFIEREIKRVSPDVIMCDLCRTAEYLNKVRDFKGLKILEMQDLISKRYVRQLQHNNLSNNIYGAYEEKIPRIVRVIFQKFNINKIVLKLEIILLRRYEKNIVNKFDNIILVSKKEAIELNKITNSKKAIAVQLGVDKSFYEYESNKYCKDDKTIGFIGNTTVAHNRDTVINFVENIFPKILQQDSNIKFMIIGKCDDWLIKKYSTENIKFTGEVDDIKRFAVMCSVIIAPLVYGSGIKTKVLEALALGMPVITNKIGVEGINVKNYVHLIVAENERLHEEVLNLIKSKETQDKLSVNGKNFVTENFAWEKNLKMFDSILESVKLL